jgi:spermidine synthase
MSLDASWFTEIDSPKSCAFSLHIKAKLHEEKTPFQQIAIYETTEFGNLMTLDDMVMLTERDNFIYHEMISHPVLFTHPEPREVAIIGGGDCGTLHEVLKHRDIERVLQIEIDERVTRLSEKYFPMLCESNDDPRAEFCFEDGIKWMANAPDNSLDVIIVDSTDPLGPGEGLFTIDFYRDCLRVLTPEGLLVQQSESPLLHLPLLQFMHEAMREAGFENTRSLQFPLCVYPSGWWTATLAGSGDLTQFREEDAQKKSFGTRYYNAEIQKASFVLPNFLIEALPGDKSPTTK